MKDIYCLHCGKPLSRWQKKFCSRSCAATYNNLKRGPMSDDTKNKIRESLNKLYPDKKNKNISKPRVRKINHCVICGCEINTRRKTCSDKCLAIYNDKINQIKRSDYYQYYLNHQEEFCRPNYTPKFKKEFIEEQGGVCAICGCYPVWNNKPLVFILDHIDGDASNNRRDNLRCICPNCDTQLDTFKSKNKHSTRKNYWKEKIINSIKNDD